LHGITKALLLLFANNPTDVEKVCFYECKIHNASRKILKMNLVFS